MPAEYTEYLPKIKERGEECTATNGRFGASGAVARPKVCANLEVFRPSERQWKPRQAAGTLSASGAQNFRGTLPWLNLTTCKKIKVKRSGTT